MPSTRIINDGMLCTIAGATITFPNVVGIKDAYTTSHFIINITKTEGKAIASVTADTSGRLTAVTVAAIDTWVDTDRYALALTNAPTQVYTSIGTALTAAAADDELVIYPSILGGEVATAGFSSSLLIIDKNVTIKGYSPVHKAFLSSDDDKRFGNPAGTLKFEDVIIVYTAGTEFLFQTAPGAGDVNFSRCFFIVPSRAGQLMQFARTAKFLFKNCIFWIRTAINVSSAASPVIEFYNCLAIAHNFAGAAFFGPASNGSVKVVNCVHVPFPFGTITDGFGTGFTGDSDFNASALASDPPGSNSILITPANVKMAYSSSPSGDSQYPFDFRPTSGSSLAAKGTTVAGVPAEDYHGLLRPIAGVQTIGPVNLDTNSGGIAWPGLGGPQAVVTPPTPTEVKDVLFPLQKAIFNLLNGDAQLVAIAPTRDNVDQNTPFPYIMLGEFDVSESRTHGIPGHEVIGTIHVFSDAKSFKECYTIKGHLDRLLADKPRISVDDFFDVNSWSMGTNTLREDFKGRRTIRHLIQRYRFRLLQSS